MTQRLSLTITQNLLLSGIKLLDSFVTSVLEFLVVVSIELNYPDGPFQVRYFGCFGNPVEVYLVDRYVFKCRIHDFVFVFDFKYFNFVNIYTNYTLFTL